MTDRPIIFSAPMVRALLEGRKTQTRRVLKMSGRTPDFIGPRGCENDPTCWGWEMPDGYFVTVEGDEADHAPGWRNGWRDWVGAYAPSDRLWVREAFVRYHDLDESDMRVGPLNVAYRADGGFRWLDADTDTFRDSPPWKPSIYMPRWASRLTLTVTDVLVQRLQEISEADAIAEGCSCDSDGWRDYQMPATQCCATASDSYRTLWNSLYGHDAWDANPWVSAITFRTIHANIDSTEATA